MDVIGEYSKLIDSLRKEQIELFKIKENLNIFSFIEKNKINLLMKEYDKAIYRNLLKLDKAIIAEYEFIEKHRIFNAKNH